MPVKRTIVYCFAFASLFYLIACSDAGSGKSGSSESKLFKKIPASESGISFANLVDENYQHNYFDSFAYVYNGAGVAVGDINNDGLQDIYFNGNEVPNRLYLNMGGMKFKDITQEAGVDGGAGWDNGVTMVDINQDGYMDIYICKGGFRDSDATRKNVLYINQGDGRFKEMAAEYGLADSGYSQQALFFDMDNDNDLDVYIAARPDSFYLGLSQMVKGKRNPPDYARNKLYRNEKGKYIEIGKEARIGQTYGYALSVTNADLNMDGFEDIFISNDYADNDYMFINQGDGTFKDEIKKATNHNSLFSMGADIADINNDGLEDIIVMEMLPENYKRSKVSMPRMDVEGFWAIVDSGFHRQYMHNALHLNQGNLFFSDISQLAGVSKTEWSWSTLLSDFDNDGQRDIFVANGYRRDLFDGDILDKQQAYVQANLNKYSSADDMFRRGFKEYIEIYDPIKVTNYLYKNKGNLKFENVSAAWGFEDSSFSNGAAIADFDNDGDIDLVINNLDQEAFLYENISEKKNQYLQLKLEGPVGNSDGIGAKIAIYYDGKMQQYFEQKTVRGYMSSNDPKIHFGLGDIAQVDSIVVSWLDGKENILKEVKTNQQVAISYKDAVPAIDRRVKFQPVFVADNEVLSTPFVHKENVYDEYKDQVLLPHMFSRTGPFIAVGDVNGDGIEDFYVGGAAGQAGRLYIQQDDKLELQKVYAFEKDAAFEDIGTVFFDSDQDGDLDLYVVSGGSEFEEGSKMYQDRLYHNNGKGGFSAAELPVTTSSGSCVTFYDIDADGDLDIFRGGLVVPHQYPYSPRSYILINDKGKFTDRTMEWAPELAKAGMVQTAVWADLDGDKKAELILSGEWMPIKIFGNLAGKLVDQTERYGLTGTEGWWNKLVTADIDGDGDLDLVAGNLGENYKFSASAKKPFEVYAKDFDRNGTNDIFLAKYNGGIQVPIRGRECTSQQCPFIAEKFPSFLSFAETDLKTILGDQIESALHYKAVQFSSMIWINEKGNFKEQRLPVEAQLSTINGIIVNDFDADGIQDILLAGNKFDVEVETTPADASPGLFLKGKGKGAYQVMSIEESGFFVPYNVKDIQLLHRKKGTSVLVSSNNDALRVFSSLN
ncbi:VCBS repeat-containing protein [Flavihumibacter sp. UBA7668]|uniref:VCBS repeat-containing protein n=1 Tax=Flavihumibacter sp. UBA7668 TaxID=1946542 RepID=UPI0025C49BD2|nr:FG-GAP-like repeat-containing protein [Flavihumibacter sp. UBA7668]